MISEGLHENDLDGVLIPVISIDEYHGKIDDESIVISFFLTDPNAAFDLSSFIESGPFEILDSDVSKAINEDGYYQVFIEMERTRSFYYEIKDIIESLDSLVGKQRWSFMAPATKGDAVIFDKEHIKKFVSYKPTETPKTDSEKSMEESVMDYLSNSDATNVRIAEGKIIIENHHVQAVNKFVTLSDPSLLAHILGLGAHSPNSDRVVMENLSKLSKALGHDWIVESSGNFITVVSPVDRSKMLLLK